MGLREAFGGPDESENATGPLKASDGQRSLGAKRAVRRWRAASRAGAGGAEVGRCEVGRSGRVRPGDSRGRSNTYVRGRLQERNVQPCARSDVSSAGLKGGTFGSIPASKTVDKQSQKHRRSVLLRTRWLRLNPGGGPLRLLWLVVRLGLDLSNQVYRQWRSNASHELHPLVDRDLRRDRCVQVLPVSAGALKAYVQVQQCNEPDFKVNPVLVH